MDVADMTVVEHQLSHMDTTAQAVQAEKAVYPPSFVSVFCLLASGRVSAGLFS